MSVIDRKQQFYLVSRYQICKPLKYKEEQSDANIQTHRISIFSIPIFSMLLYTPKIPHNSSI